MMQSRHDALRHPGARPAARLRPGDSPEGRALPGRDGRGRQLRAAPTGSCSPTPPGGVFRDAGRRRAASWSTTSRTTSPRSRRHRSTGRRRACACTARAPPGRFPPGHPDLPADLVDGRPAGAGARLDGHRLLRAGRRAPTGRRSTPTCHGAGRRLSRHQAARPVHAPTSCAASSTAAGSRSCGARHRRGLAEEAPEAYKDVDEVVAVAERAGLCRRVARLVPLGVVKG